jgi:death-on-curing protein
MRRPQWIDRRALVLLHEETLAEHGGLAGWRDENALESALARRQNLQPYEPKADLSRLAAAYAFGLIRDHPFNDGNKRVGFLAIGLFLALNGYGFEVSQIEAVEAINRLAAGNLAEADLAKWIREHKVRSR